MGDSDKYGDSDDHGVIVGIRLGDGEPLELIEARYVSEL